MGLFGPDRTPEEEQRLKEENRRFVESMRLSREENRRLSQEAKSKCAEEIKRLYECQSSRQVFVNLCTEEFDEYIRCYRKHRGFARVGVLGMNLNASEYVSDKKASASDESEIYAGESSSTS